MINFITANHTPFVVPEDIFEYFVQGFRAIGINVKYSLTYRDDAINLILENMKMPMAGDLAAARQRAPASRLYVIATEILTGHGFNSANVTQVHSGGGHYGNLEYWKERTAAFIALAPHADGLIFPSEALIDGYRYLGRRWHYLPMAALPTQPPLAREPDDQLDIDVFFSGTITEYRSGMIQRLRARDLSVVIQAPHYPDYMRRHMLARSKMAVGLKLAPDTEFTSKLRAHYYLTHRIPHVFQRTPDQTDLHSFLNFVDTEDDLIDMCVERSLGEYAFDDSVFEAYRAAPHLDYRVVFGSLEQFLDGRS